MLFIKRTGPNTPVLQASIFSGFNTFINANDNSKANTHNGTECTGPYFEISFKTQAALRDTGVVKFSNTHKCRYAPLNKENYNRIFFAVQGLAPIEQSELHQYLAEKKKQKPPVNHKLIQAVQKSKTACTVNTAAPDGKQVREVTRREIYYKSEKISLVNAHVIADMGQRLKLKAYSPSTIKTYLNEMSQLLSLLKDVPADKLTAGQLKRYRCFALKSRG